jgi:ferredoxin-NADP reductase
VQFLGGGSGVAPLMAMLRERVRSGSDVPIRYLSSARSYDELIFRQELESITSEAEDVEVLHTLTRSQPPDWTGLTGRVNRVMLAQHVWPAFTRPLCYVCGPTGFVETVASALVALGHQPGRIKTERFGPTS